MSHSARPRIAVTLGDPRGIGPEVTIAALADPALVDQADFVIVGPETAEVRALEGAFGHVELEALGRWQGGGDLPAGRMAGRAIERAIDMALDGAVSGLVTAPISKTALRVAGYDVPGHTELLRARCGVPDVAMVMAAERTPLGGTLRVGLLTVHVALREVPDLLTVELVERRTRIVADALRSWWGIETPRLALAGVNPHASEGGMFGDEEERVLAPALDRLGGLGGLQVVGILPADTVFRRCVEGSIDAVMVPYHDVGLAVLKTLAGREGVNVTTGLPFPRTSPDHGTAFDIAGRGLADASSMRAAVLQCIRFCQSLG